MFRRRWLEGDGPDEAQRADGEGATFRAEAAGRQADHCGVAERGKKEEIAVAELIGGFGAEGIGAELLVDTAVTGGEFEKMRVGVIHESPAVLLLAGIEHDQGCKTNGNEDVRELVAHGRECEGEGCGRELERSIRQTAYGRIQKAGDRIRIA